MIRVMKVSAVTASTNQFQKRQQEPKIKYYNNKVTKTTVKKDFGIMLDEEISKLKVDILI